MSSINKIHVTNSTGLSLNERFTAIKDKHVPTINVRRSRSRSRSQPNARTPPERTTSLANRRLLQQLSRRHKMQTALKLKRRSMRTIGSGGAMKRGSIKALRVGANGRPIKTNSLTNIATMKADLIPNGNRRPLRRSNSLANRLNTRRPSAGGAAERIARRRLQRMGDRIQIKRNNDPRRGRSRSRSAVRLLDGGSNRGRSQSRGRSGFASARRGRSRSLSRGRNEAGTRTIPIKARLGVRPGNGRLDNRRDPRRTGRGQSISRRGVAAGRIQKRRNSRTQKAGNAQNAVAAAATSGAGRRIGRSRERSTIRNRAGRSRSRSRKGVVGQQQRSGTLNRGRRPRGRSVPRAGKNGATQKQGNGQQQQQQQLRRGRSRSRGVRRGVSGRNLGKGNPKRPVNKDLLDKELDQYMATTKTETDMDYLLKN